MAKPQEGVNALADELAVREVPSWIEAKDPVEEPDVVEEDQGDDLPAAPLFG